MWDAIKSYQAGAYRAAIVSTWVTIVFDLIEKIRELSTSGDRAATDVLTRFDNIQSQIALGSPLAIEKGIKFERDILDVSRDRLQLLGSYEYLELKRVREDRNRCAHPTFQHIEQPYMPTAELARAHIRNAVDCLLALPPVQGRAALERLKALVTSDYFPHDYDNCKTQLEHSDIRRPTESLVRSFIDFLIFSFFEEGNRLRFMSRTLHSLRICIEMHRYAAEPRLRHQMNKIASKIPDKDIRGLIAVAGYVPDAWELLDAAARIRITNFVRGGPAPELARVVRSAIKIDALKAPTEERLARFNISTLAMTVNLGLGTAAIPYAKALYDRTKSPRDRKRVVDTVLLPLTFYMSRRDFEDLIICAGRREAPEIASDNFQVFVEFATEILRMDEEYVNAVLRQNGLPPLAPRTSSDDDDQSSLDFEDGDSPTPL